MFDKECVRRLLKNILGIWLECGSAASRPAVTHPIATSPQHWRAIQIASAQAGYCRRERRRRLEADPAVAFAAVKRMTDDRAALLYALRRSARENVTRARIAARD